MKIFPLISFLLLLDQSIAYDAYNYYHYSKFMDYDVKPTFHFAYFISASSKRSHMTCLNDCNLLVTCKTVLYKNDFTPNCLMYNKAINIANDAMASTSKASLMIKKEAKLDESCIGTRCDLTAGLYCDSNFICKCKIQPSLWSNTVQVCVACPTGWSLFMNRCYYVNPTIMLQSNALSWCQLYGSTLVIINDATEYNYIQSIFFPLNEDSAWVGGRILNRVNLISTFVWFDNTPVNNWWCPSEPNNINCEMVNVICEGLLTVVNPKNGNDMCLNDLDSAKLLPFICEFSTN